MKSHFDSLKEHIPDLDKRYILDLGSGRGKFLIDIASMKGAAAGLELFQEYIDESYRHAEAKGLKIEVEKGVGENIPFADATFDFVNMSEVIEHVDDPNKTMQEVYRVLKTGGKAYVSVPSRFSIKDTHFHLYFVNWLPRFMSDGFISIFGKHKDYSGETGRQRLKELHYYTYGNVCKMLKEIGFNVQDGRELKIKKRFKGLSKVFLPVYKIARTFYFDTFHLILSK